MGVALTKDAVCPPIAQQSDYIIPQDSIAVCKRSANGQYFEKIGQLRPDFPQKIPARGAGKDNCPSYTPPPQTKSFACATNVIDFCNNYTYLQAAGYKTASQCISDITNRGGKLPSVPCVLNYQNAVPSIQQDADGSWKVVSRAVVNVPGVPETNCDLSDKKIPYTVDPTIINYCNNSYYLENNKYTSAAECISDIVNNKNNIPAKVPCKTQLVDDTPNIVKEGPNYYKVQKTQIIQDGFPPGKCATPKVNSLITIDSGLNAYCSNSYYLQKNGFGSKEECVLSLINTNPLPSVSCNVQYVDDTPRIDIVNGQVVTRQKPIVTNKGYPETNCKADPIITPYPVPDSIISYCQNPYFLKYNGFASSVDCQLNLVQQPSIPKVPCDVSYVTDSPAFINSGGAFYSVKKPVVANQGYPQGNCPTSSQLDLVKVDLEVSSYCSNPYYNSRNGFASKEDCIVSILNNNNSIPSINCTFNFKTEPSKLFEQDGSIVGTFDTVLTGLGYPQTNCNAKSQTKPYTPSKELTTFCSNPYFLSTLGYTSVNACIIDIYNNKNSKLPSVPCKVGKNTDKIIKDIDGVYKQVYVKTKLADGTPDQSCDLSNELVRISVPNEVSNYCNNSYYLKSNAYNTKDECVLDILNNKSNLLSNVPCDVSYSPSSPEIQYINGEWVRVSDPTINNLGYPPSDCNVTSKQSPYNVSSDIANWCSNTYYRQNIGYATAVDCISDIVNNKRGTLPTVPCTYTYPAQNSSLVATADGFTRLTTGAVSQVGYPTSCQPTMRSEKAVVSVNTDIYCRNPYYLSANGYANYAECVVALDKTSTFPNVKCTVDYKPANPVLQKRAGQWVLVQNAVVQQDGYPATNCDLSDKLTPFDIPQDVADWCNNSYFRSVQGTTSVDSCISKVMNEKNGVLPSVPCATTYQTAQPPFRKDLDGVWKLVENQIVTKQGYPEGQCKTEPKLTPISVPDDIQTYCNNPYYLTANGYLSVDGCIRDILNNKGSSLPLVDCDIAYSDASPAYQVKEGVIVKVQRPTVTNSGYPPKCNPKEIVTQANISPEVISFCNNPYYTNSLGYDSAQTCILDILNSNKPLPNIPCSYTYKPDTPFIHKEDDGNWYKVNVPEVIAKGYPALDCNIAKQTSPYSVDPAIMAYCTNEYYLKQSGYINTDSCISDLVNNLKVFPTISCTGFYRDATPTYQRDQNGQWFKVKTFVPTIPGVPSSNCVVPDQKIPIDVPAYIDDYCNNPYYVKMAGYGDVTQCVDDLLSTKAEPKSIDCDLAYTPVGPAYTMDSNGNWVSKKQTQLVHDGYPKGNCDLPVVSVPASIPANVVEYCNNPYFLRKNGYASDVECIFDIMNYKRGQLPNVDCNLSYVPSIPFYQQSPDGGRWNKVYDAIVSQLGHPPNGCDTSQKVVPFDVPVEVQTYCRNPYFLSKNGFANTANCIDVILNQNEAVPFDVDCDVSVVDAKPKYSADQNGQVLLNQTFKLNNKGFNTTCPSGIVQKPADLPSQVADFCSNDYYLSKSGYANAVDCALDLLNNKNGALPNVACSFDIVKGTPAYNVDQNGNWFLNQYKVVKNQGYPLGSCENVTPAPKYLDASNTSGWANIQSYCNNPYYLSQNKYADAQECVRDVLNNLDGKPKPVACSTKTVESFYEQQDGVWVKRDIKQVVLGKQGYPENDCDVRPVVTPVDTPTITKVKDWCSKPNYRENNLYKAYGSETECIVDLLTNSKNDKNEVVLPTVPCVTRIVDTGQLSFVNGKWVTLKTKEIVDPGFNTDCNVASMFMNIDTNTTQFQAVQDFCNNPYYRSNNSVRPFDDALSCIDTVVNQLGYQLPTVPCSTTVKDASPKYQLINNKIVTVQNKAVEFGKEAVGTECDTSDIVTPYNVPSAISGYCNNPYFLSYNGWSNSNSCVLDILNFYDGVPPSVNCKTTTSVAAQPYQFRTDAQGNRQFYYVQNQTVTEQGYGGPVCTDTEVLNLRYPATHYDDFCNNPYYLRKLGYNSNNAQTNYETCIIDRYTKDNSKLKVECETESYSIAKPYSKAGENKFVYQTATKVLNDGYPVRTWCKNEVTGTAYTLPNDVAQFCSNVSNGFYWRNNPYYDDPVQGMTFLGSYTGYDHCVLDILNLHHGGNIQAPNTSRMKVPCEFTSADATPKYILDSDGIYKSVKNFSVSKDGYPANSCSDYSVKTNVNSSNTPNFNVITNFCDNPYWRSQSNYASATDCVLSLLNSTTQTPPNVSCTGTILDTIDKIRFNSNTNTYESVTELKSVLAGFPTSNICNVGPFTGALNLTESPYGELKNFCENTWYRTQSNFGTVDSCVTSILKNRNYPASVIEVRDLKRNVTMTSSMSRFVSGTYAPTDSTVNGELQVSLNTFNSRGNLTKLYSNNKIQTWDRAEINFDVNIGANAQADAIWLFIGSNDPTRTDEIEGNSLNSFQLVFQVYAGAGKTQGLTLYKNGGVVAQTWSTNSFLTGQWINVRVSYTLSSTNTWIVYVNDTERIRFSDPNNASWAANSGNFWGFASRVGGLGGDYSVRRVCVYNPKTLITAYDRFNNVITDGKNVVVTNNASLGLNKVSVDLAQVLFVSKVVITPPWLCQGLVAGSTVALASADTTVNPNPFLTTLSSVAKPQSVFYPYTLPTVNCNVTTTNTTYVSNVDGTKVVRRDTVAQVAGQPSYPVGLCATLNPTTKDTPFTNIDSELDGFCTNTYYRNKAGFSTYAQCVTTALNTAGYKLPSIDCEVRYSDEGNRYIADTDGLVKVSQALTVLNDGFPSNSCWNPSLFDGLLGWYDGESWNGTNWIDKSGNGNNVTVIKGSPISTDSIKSFGSNKTFKILKGTINDGLTFPASTMLPQNYTLFTVARYSDSANAKRIFDGTNMNWLSGYWQGNVGVAYHGDWIQWISPSVGVQTAATVNNWNIVSDVNNNVWWNGKNRKRNVPSTMGRYVRLVQPNAMWLNIAEIEVYDTNGVYLPATPSQSSVLGGLGPSALTDRNTSSIAHTNGEVLNWMMLDLGADYNIGKIKIYNRQDCCKERINGAVLTILSGTSNLNISNPSGLVWFSNIQNATNLSVLEWQPPFSQNYMTANTWCNLSINNGLYTPNASSDERSAWEVGLVLIYNRNLSDGERQTVESWISDKYGLALDSTANYISFGGRKTSRIASGFGTNGAAATNCQGNDCTIEGQMCFPGTLGAGSNTWVCEAGKWTQASEGIPPEVDSFCNVEFNRTSSLYNSYKECVLDVMNNLNTQPPSISCKAPVTTPVISTIKEGTDVFYSNNLVDMIVPNKLVSPGGTTFTFNFDGTFVVKDIYGSIAFAGPVNGWISGGGNLPSTLVLGKDGRFFTKDRVNTVPIVNTTTSALPTRLQLFDNGNLFLYDSNGNILWQLASLQGWRALTASNDSATYKSLQTVDTANYKPGYDNKLNTNLGYSAKDLMLSTSNWTAQKAGGSYVFTRSPNMTDLFLLLNMPSFVPIPGVTYTMNLSAFCVQGNAVVTVECPIGTVLSTINIGTVNKSYTATFTVPTNASGMMFWKFSIPTQRNNFVFAISNLTLRANPQILQTPELDISSIGCIQGSCSPTALTVQGLVPNYVYPANYVFSIELFISSLIPPMLAAGIISASRTFILYTSGDKIGLSFASQPEIFTTYPTDIWFTLTCVITPLVAKLFINGSQKASLAGIFSFSNFGQISNWAWRPYYGSQIFAFAPDSLKVRNAVWFPNKLISDTDISRGFCLTPQPEVFQIGNYDKTKDAAATACAAVGAKLATVEQVKQAWKDGAQWCSWGHTTTDPAFPMQLTRVDGCNGASAPSYGQMTQFNPALTTNWNNGQYAANCYGIKPTKGTSSATNVLPFRGQDFENVYSKGSYGNLDKGESYTNNLFAASKIFLRECKDCVDTHKNIFYKRLTPIPSSLSIYRLFNNWTSANNILNTDFKLYSSWADLQADTNAWTSCTYDDLNIGFPRDCGPTAPVSGQWNSLTRGGQPNVRFRVYNPYEVWNSPRATDRTTVTPATLNQSIINYCKNSYYTNNAYPAMTYEQCIMDILNNRGGNTNPLPPAVDCSYKDWVNDTPLYAVDTDSVIKKAEKRDVLTQGYPAGNCPDTNRKSPLSSANVAGWDNINAFCSSDYLRNSVYNPPKSYNDCVLDILNNKGGAPPLVPCNIPTSVQTIVGYTPVDVGRANSWAFTNTTNTAIPQVPTSGDVVYTIDLELKIAQSAVGRDSCLFDNAGRYPALFIYPAPQRKLHFVHQPQSAGNAIVTNGTFTADTWFRFTIIVNKTTISTYFNGVKDAFVSNGSSPMTWVATPNWVWNAYNNLVTGEVQVRNFKLYVNQLLAMPQFSVESSVVKQSQTYSVLNAGTPGYGGCDGTSINPVLIPGLVGLYEPDSYKNVGGSYIWYDKTSNQQNATISANPSITTVNVSNGTSTFQALQGTVNDRITFPSGILPSTYTLITVARYSPAGTARG